MTAVAQVLAGVKFVSDHNPIPGRLGIPLAASAQGGLGQFMTVDPTTGYCALNDGSSANQISAGLVDDVQALTGSSATAGLATAILSERWFYGLTDSTIASDGFTVADFAYPFYVASEQTLGKLSHSGADATLVNRSIGGLVFGKADDGTTLAWAGPIAWLLARCAVIVNARAFATTSFALSTGTTRTEMVLPRNGKSHGHVTQVRVARAVAGTDGDTDYWTFTVAKRTATTPGTAVTIASKTTKTTAGIGAMAAFVYYDLTITDANADILETDILTIVATAATGSSPAITQLTCEVIGKVA